MKKYQAAIITVTVTASLLTACAGIPAGQGTGEPAVTEAVTEPIKIENETQPESEAAAEESGGGAESASESAAPVDGTEEAVVPQETKAPNPPRVYSVTAFQKTMYATQPVNVRASYTMQSEVLTCLSTNQKVEVTGRSANGWMRVVYNGRDAYVYQKYLSDGQKEDGESEAETNISAPAENQTGSGPIVPSGPGPQTGPSVPQNSGQNQAQIPIASPGPAGEVTETLIPGMVSGPGNPGGTGVITGVGPGM